MLCNPSASTRSIRRVWITLLLLLWCAFPATADPTVPDVLDYIPPSHQIILATTSIDRLDANSAQLMASLEMTTMSTLSQALVALGLKDILDTAGSAAVVITDVPDEAGAEFPSIMVLPVRGFDQFILTVDARTQGGSFAFDYGNRPYFTKQVGERYAAISADRALIESFPVDRAHAREHAARLGAVGSGIADRSDIVLIGDSAAMRAVSELVMDPIRRAISTAGAVDAEAAEAQATLLERFREQMLADARLGVIGVSSGPLGVLLDSAALFEADSLMDIASRDDRAAPPTVQPLRRLPAHPFIFLAATDFAHPGIRSIVKDALGRHAPQGPDAGPDTRSTLLRTLLDTDSGEAVVYLPSEPIIMGGIASNILVRWSSAQPDNVMKGFASMVRSLDGSSVKSGPSGTALLRANYAEQQSAVGPITADAWSISTDAQINALALGYNTRIRGISGVRGDEGFITTGDKPDLFLAAMRLPDQGAAILDDPVIRQLSEMLPERPTVLWMLNAKPVIDQFAPLAALAIPGLRIPPQIPPIAGSVKLDQGAVRMTVFAPAPLIKLGFSVTNATRPGQGQPPQRPSAPPNAPR